MVKYLILFLLDIQVNRYKAEIERLKNEQPIYRNTKKGISRSIDNESIDILKRDIIKLTSAINGIETTKHKKFIFKNMFFCRHKNVKFLRFVYGDEINVKNTRRIHVCEDCGSEIILKEDRMV